MLFKENTNNISIKIFWLLPLSIHVNIYNLSIMHKIMEIQKIITATKRQDTIYNRNQNLKVKKFFYRYLIETI